MDASIPNWCDLPKHLLDFIAQKLPTRYDVILFGAVCGKFLSSSPPPPKRLLSPPSALSIPFSARLGSEIYYVHFAFTESTVYAIQSLDNLSNSNPEPVSPTWIVRVKESKSDSVQVTHTLSPQSVFIDIDHRLPKSLNLLDYRVTELTKTYGIKKVDSDTCQDEGVASRRTMSCLRERVVITDSFDIMGMYVGGKLAGLREKEDHWIDINVNITGRDYFEDFIFYNKKFYAANLLGVTISVDCKTLNVKEVAGPLPKWGYLHMYLVKSNDDLYLIAKNSYGLGMITKENFSYYPIDFNLFRLDEEKGEWVEIVGGIEDRVFLAGENGSFCFSTKDISGCIGNSVYFHDKMTHGASDIHPDRDTGIFQFKDCTARPIWTFPGYANIFWPPPAWLKDTSA